MTEFQGPVIFTIAKDPLPLVLGPHYSEGASFVSDTPPKCLDREGLGRRRTGGRLKGTAMSGLATSQPLIST